MPQRPDLPRFSHDELDTMAAKTLRMYCIQLGRLPSGPVERGDLVQALRPYATGQQKKPEPAPASPPSGVPMARAPPGSMASLLEGGKPTPAAATPAAPCGDYTPEALKAMTTKNL